MPMRRTRQEIQSEEKAVRSIFIVVCEGKRRAQVCSIMHRSYFYHSSILHVPAYLLYQTNNFAISENELLVSRREHDVVEKTDKKHTVYVKYTHHCPSLHYLYLSFPTMPNKE